MEVPARRFYALLFDMKRLHREKKAELLLGLCDVALMPSLRRDSQHELRDHLQKQAYPEIDRVKPAYDLKKDQDIIGRHLFEVFKQKSRTMQ